MSPKIPERTTVAFKRSHICLSVWCIAHWDLRDRLHYVLTAYTTNGSYNFLETTFGAPLDGSGQSFEIQYYCKETRITVLYSVFIQTSLKRNARVHYFSREHISTLSSLVPHRKTTPLVISSFRKLRTFQCTCMFWWQRCQQKILIIHLFYRVCLQKE